MSEEGFRSSLAQIAVPGVAISAFVTAYATVSLSYPVAASLLSLGGLGELGEGLPLQQQQQSPPYCPLKDTSADNIARMSLAALTLKEEVQQLESWS
eukprot:gene24297-26048_t